MRKKFLYPLFLFAFLALGANANAENFKKPDYKKIKKEIQNPKSEYYYPVLYDRYVKSDTTLTILDYRALYYGFIFDAKYSPYGRSDYADSLNLIYDKDSLTIMDYQEIVRFENKVLEDYPFNLRDVYGLANAYYQLGDTAAMELAGFRLNMLAETILSTGNGKTEKTAWHVIAVGHEYDILSYYGFLFGGQQSLTTGGCDYLELAPNEYEIEGFYFDVNVLLNKQKELFR